MTEWSESEISYLKNLSSNCERLASRFNTIQSTTKAYQHRLKIPAIILSSVAGLFSFGSSSFEESATKAISITVGGVNILIAILNSLDSLFGLTDTIQKASKVSVEFAKLKEHIDMVLSLPPDSRGVSAEGFIKDAYNEYLSVLEGCPQVLKNLRFIQYGTLGQATSDIASTASSNGIPCFGIKKISQEDIPIGTPTIRIDLPKDP